MLALFIANKCNIPILYPDITHNDPFVSFDIKFSVRVWLKKWKDCYVDIARFICINNIIIYNVYFNIVDLPKMWFTVKVWL